MALEILNMLLVGNLLLGIILIVLLVILLSKNNKPNNPNNPGNPSKGEKIREDLKKIKEQINGE